MRLLLAHPTGNQFFRHLAAGLAAGGQLGVVASCFNSAGFLDGMGRLMPARARAELERRAFREPWAVGLETHPVREVGRLLAQRLGWGALTRHETGCLSVDAIYQDFDRWVARRLSAWRRDAALEGVYAYEDGALATFQAADTLGLHRVYDLPIAYWETSGRLLREEAERWPAWETTLGATSDSPGKLQRKTRELELAETVICPSQFVVDSLPGWARETKRVVLAPFGSPGSEDGGWPQKGAEGARTDGGVQRTAQPAVGPAKAGGSWPQKGAEGAKESPDFSDREFQVPTKSQEPITNNQEPTRRLRVLFAGSMSQRKGLADLLAAMRLLKRAEVELVVMGSLQAPLDFYRGEFPDFTYEPGRPHAAVLELMRTCDVLVLPSIVEGRALVIQEAMSQGLPVIITPNTGGSDLIEEGGTGFLVPIRSPGAIAEKIAWCADHRGELAAMGQSARRKAQAYSWRRYYEAIIAALAG